VNCHRLFSFWSNLHGVDFLPVEPTDVWWISLSLRKSKTGEWDQQNQDLHSLFHEFSNAEEAQKCSQGWAYLMMATLSVVVEGD